MESDRFVTVLSGAFVGKNAEALGASEASELLLRAYKRAAAVIKQKKLDEETVYRKLFLVTLINSELGLETGLASESVYSHLGGLFRVKSATLLDLWAKRGEESNKFVSECILFLPPKASEALLDLTSGQPSSPFGKCVAALQSLRLYQTKDPEKVLGVLRNFRDDTFQRRSNCSFPERHN